MGNEAESSDLRPTASTHALNPASFLPHGRCLLVAEFHSLCPDGKGYTQDNNIVNYGIPAHRGKPQHRSARLTRSAPTAELWPAGIAPVLAGLFPRPGVRPAHSVTVCPAPPPGPAPSPRAEKPLA